MEFENLEIEGIKLIKGNKFSDERGAFFKYFNDDIFKENGIQFEIKEAYYSISNKDVIRGMHFQTGEYSHNKLVYAAQGSVLDVVLDLRKTSNTYKKFCTVELSEKNGYMLFIPRGCAHGFKSLEDNSLMVYNVSTVYSKEHDSGVRYDSFGMDWGIENPIISLRDKSFITLDEFDKQNK